MPLKPFQEKFLDLLEEKELKLSELYKALSEKFAVNSEFWHNLAEKKLFRLQQIEQFVELAKNEEMGFYEKNTKTYTLNTFLESIQEIQSQLGNVNFSEIKALSLCHDLENSILERRVYEYFIPYNNEQRNMLDKMEADINDFIKYLADQKKKLFSITQN